MFRSSSVISLKNSYNSHKSLNYSSNKLLNRNAFNILNLDSSKAIKSKKQYYNISKMESININ